ncbi:Tryptophan synthase alpha chain [Streptomyces tendae]
MTYWNPIDRYGVERFTAELAEAGGAGASCPTCRSRSRRCGGSAPSKHGLATVFVVAPSSQDARLAEITAAGSGFVYAASLMGVTGTRESVGAQAAGPGAAHPRHHRHSRSASASASPTPPRPPRSPGSPTA